MSKPITTIYMAVRRVVDEGYEWPDVGTASYGKQIAAERAMELDAKVPQWAKANPVIRIGKFTVREEKQK